MKTIDSQTYTTIIQKSKFICKLIYLSDFQEIKKNLESVKDEYKDATHYCYAYIFDQTKRFSDDKEPNNTAGMPILNVLEKHELNHVLCIVIRYFGGIKLGVGGLVRAYTKAVTNCLEKTKILKLKKGKLIQIKFNYDKIKVIDSILDKVELKQFNNYIIYQFLISDDDFMRIKDKIKNQVNELKILKEINIKK